MALTDRQAVRVLVFDRDTGDEAGLGNPENKGFTGAANFSKDEIDYFLGLFPDEASGSAALHFLAAATACRAMAAKNVRRSVTASTGGTFTHDSRQIAVNWRQLAKDYEEEAKNSAPGFFIANHSDTVFAREVELHRWAVDRFLV